jgi:hypothetical protein
LADVAAQVQSDLVPEDTSGVGIVMTAQDFPTRAVVTFTGEYRPVTARNREMIKYWQEAWGHPATAVDMFVHEMRVVEGGTGFWIPIQRNLRPFLEEEMSPGELMTLLTTFVGGDRTGSSIRCVFIGNEFQTEVLWRSFSLGAMGEIVLGEELVSPQIVEPDTDGLVRLREGTYSGADAIRLRLESGVIRGMYFEYREVDQFDAYNANAIQLFGEPETTQGTEEGASFTRLRWLDAETEMLITRRIGTDRSWVTLSLVDRAGGSNDP